LNWQTYARGSFDPQRFSRALANLILDPAAIHAIVMRPDRWLMANDRDDLTQRTATEARHAQHDPSKKRNGLPPWSVHHTQPGAKP
jgi:hypothetical protein